MRQPFHQNKPQMDWSHGQGGASANTHCSLSSGLSICGAAPRFRALRTGIPCICWVWYKVQWLKVRPIEGCSQYTSIQYSPCKLLSLPLILNITPATLVFVLLYMVSSVSTLNRYVGLNKSMCVQVIREHVHDMYTTADGEDCGRINAHVAAYIVSVPHAQMHAR